MNERPSLQSYGNIYSSDYNIGLSNLVYSYAWANIKSHSFSRDILPCLTNLSSINLYSLVLVFVIMLQLNCFGKLKAALRPSHAT